MSTADKLNKLLQTKADIKLALIDKGLNPTDVFSTYADNIRAIETGSGSGGVFDFAAIGYTGNEEPIKSGLAYAKEIYDNWEPTSTSRSFSGNLNLIYLPKVDTSNYTSMYQMFYNCYNLQCVPPIDTSNVTNMSDMFYGCTGLSSLDVSGFDTSNVTTMYAMFSGCVNIKELNVSNFNTSNVTNMYGTFRNLSSITELDLSNFDTTNVADIRYMFYGCKGLTKLTLGSFDTSNISDFTSTFVNCSNLILIDGYISLKSLALASMSNTYWFGTTKASKLLKITFKDIGYNSSATKFNTFYISNWGVNSDTVTDARQSLIDSLITYSFDRASAGYSTCTITLSITTKALLTEDEIAQITAKGFTIA